MVDETTANTPMDGESQVTEVVSLSTEVVESSSRRRKRPVPLDEKTAYVLLRMYISRRINYQIEFYQARIREFDNNSELMIRIGAGVMALSTVLAAISSQADSGVLRLLTALLPAFAALIASFRQLYQWERQAGIYRDSILGLEEARLVVPDMDKLDIPTAKVVYPDLVKMAEQVFKDEVGQWGQIAMGKTEEGTEIDTLREFAEEYNLDIFREDGSIDEDKLGLLREIIEASQSAPNQRIAIEYPHEEPPQRTSLPAGRGGRGKRSASEEPPTAETTSTDDAGEEPAG